MDERQVQFIDKNFSRLIKSIITLAEIPTPTNDEVRRAQEVRDQLANLRLTNISFDDVGNLWVAWPPLQQISKSDKPIVLFSAHLDTVYPWETEWKVVQEGDLLQGPGVADNSTGVAFLIFIASFLKEFVTEPRNQYLLVATVGQGAQMQGIRSFIDRLWEAGLDPAKFLHVAIEGNDLGRINSGGVAVRRYEVNVQTPGGHSWYDALNPNAIHRVSEMIDKLYNQFKQESWATTFNVGTIRGGTAINAIAAHAIFTFELRASTDWQMRKLEKRSLDIINSFTKKEGVQVQTKLIGSGPSSPLHEDFPVLDIIIKILKDLGVKPQVRYGLSESNYPLSLGLQSITLGCTRAKLTHSVHESMEIPILKHGLTQFFLLITQLESNFPAGKKKEK